MVSLPQSSSFSVFANVLSTYVKRWFFKENMKKDPQKAKKKKRKGMQFKQKTHQHVAGRIATYASNK